MLQVYTEKNVTLTLNETIASSAPLAKLQWNLAITRCQGTDINTFAIKRFRYIEVLFHIFYYYWR